jgi:hypothetical protein
MEIRRIETMMKTIKEFLIGIQRGKLQEKANNEKI